MKNIGKNYFMREIGEFFILSIDVTKHITIKKEGCVWGHGLTMLPITVRMEQGNLISDKSDFKTKLVRRDKSSKFKVKKKLQG